MNESVEEVVASALPERRIETIESQTTRPGNETALVRFADSAPVYVKTASDTTERLVRETAAIRYGRSHCSVNAPAIVAADPTGDPPYLVTEPLPGTLFNDRWTDGDDREQLLRRLGQVIAGVHEARFERPGAIQGGGGESLVLETSTWTEMLCATIDWRASNWFADRFSDMPEKLIETVREVGPTIEDTVPTLLHGDPSRINVHLDPDGLIDWERALVGDPAFGVIEAEFHHVGQPDVDDAEKDDLKEALRDGYRDRAGEIPLGVDRYASLYRAIAYLLVPQTFDDWASSADQPKDELAAEVCEEFQTRYERARALVE